MSNGNIIIMTRIITSGLIGLTALIGAGLLARYGITVPYAWWLVTVITVGGVAGSDVVAAILSKGKGVTDNGDRTGRIA